jgi:hypothetical protein
MVMNRTPPARLQSLCARVSPGAGPDRATGCGARRSGTDPPLCNLHCMRPSVTRRGEATSIIDPGRLLSDRTVLGVAVVTVHVRRPGDAE